MTGVIERRAYEPGAAAEAVRADWEREGFSFGVFRDPPDKLWADFVHDTDEYVLLVHGRMVIDVGAERFLADPGDLIRIPKGVRHSLRTLSKEGSVWYYGYGHWQGADHG